MAQIRVEVVRAWPRGFQTADLLLPEGATVADAIARSGLGSTEIAGQAVFGEVVAPSRQLQDGDRLELLRPLQVDPKQARRERAQAQRSRRR